MSSDHHRRPRTNPLPLDGDLPQSKTAHPPWRLETQTVEPVCIQSTWLSSLPVAPQSVSPGCHPDVCPSALPHLDGGRADTIPSSWSNCSRLVPGSGKKDSHSHTCV